MGRPLIVGFSMYSTLAPKLSEAIWRNERERRRLNEFLCGNSRPGESMCQLVPRKRVWVVTFPQAWVLLALKVKKAITIDAVQVVCEPCGGVGGVEWS